MASPPIFVPTHSGPHSSIPPIHHIEYSISIKSGSNHYWEVTIPKTMALSMPLASHILAAILSFEIVLGGQARLPFSPTPTLYQRAMAKADGTKAAFDFVTLDANTFTHVIGAAMCLASVGVALPTTGVAGCLLSGCLSLMGV